MTPHFTLAELTHTDHRLLDNTPNAAELVNIKRLAEFLETVKTTLGGKPIMINSAFRSKAVNDAVGSTLLHLPYDQIIREYDAWTHISISDKPRRQALIIDRSSTRLFA